MLASLEVSRLRSFLGRAIPQAIRFSQERQSIRFCRPVVSQSLSDRDAIVRQEIGKLRLASIHNFRRPEFQRVCWAGIFGSFSRGTAKDSSDVDVIIIESKSSSPRTSLLDDVLPATWGRSVDIVSLDEGQKDLLGYVQLEALLASRTIYVRDEGARVEVARLRQLSKEVLAQGQRLYNDAVARIDEMRHRFDGVSAQEFLDPSEEEQTKTISDVFFTLDRLNVQPQHHPMHEAFWYIVVEDAIKIRNRLDAIRIERTSEAISPQEQLSRAVWEVITSSNDDGFERLSRMAKKFVLPALEETQGLVDRVEDIYSVVVGNE